MQVIPEGQPAGDITVGLLAADAHWSVEGGFSSLGFCERGTILLPPTSRYSILGSSSQNRGRRLGGGQSHIDEYLLYICKIWCHDQRRVQRWIREEPDMELAFKELRLYC